jgi:ribosomal protein S18 acetylase RimI-like enzyme
VLDTRHGDYSELLLYQKLGFARVGLIPAARSADRALDATAFHYRELGPDSTALPA